MRAEVSGPQQRAGGRGTPAPPGALGKESFSRGARTRRLSSPLRPAHQLALQALRVQVPPALLLVSSRALPGFEKSRSLTERSRAQRFLGARGRTRFPATAAFPAAAVSAVVGRRRVSAAATPTTVPSSAARGRGRLAAAACARPSSATGAKEAERTSLLGLLSSPPSSPLVFAAAAASGAAKLCKSSLRDPDHLSTVLLARKVLSRCSCSPDFPGRTVASLRAVSSSRAAGLSSWGRLEKGLSGRSPKHQPGSHRR